jgi:hypothetical protein
MRDLRELDGYRIADHDDPERIFYGRFEVVSKTSGRFLKIIASSDLGWDHVSVSLTNRCPNWHEMEQVKHLFFKENEVCWQYHVPPMNHINIHPFCLHIWRKQNFEIPVPPLEMI